MEIKEEMYARTLDGIMKIVELRNDGVMGRFRNEDGNIYFYNDMMCNPSFNVIDLIQVGDYVNGVLIEEIFIKDEDRLFIHSFESEVMLTLTNDNVKSIVTKEQFESMEYKL